MTTNVFQKDPHAKLDYGFNWSDWLKPGETITDNYSVTAASLVTGGSVTVESYSRTSSSVIVWISGGNPGFRYPVSCLIETTENRIDERTIKIDVKNR